MTTDKLPVDERHCPDCGHRWDDHDIDINANIVCLKIGCDCETYDL